MIRKGEYYKLNMIVLRNETLVKTDLKGYEQNFNKFIIKEMTKKKEA